MMEELKPCPFCGHEPEVTVWRACGLSPDLEDLARIRCDNPKCGIKPGTTFMQYKSVVASWNRRADDE